MWKIVIHVAQKTLKATTQDGICLLVGPTHWWFKVKWSHLRYPVLNTAFYSNTLFSNMTGIGCDTCGQVFTTDFDFIKFFPMKKRSNTRNKLSELVKTIGIMKKLVMDGSLELSEGD